MPLPSSRASSTAARSVSGVWLSVACGVTIGLMSPFSAPFTFSAYSRNTRWSSSVSAVESSSGWSLLLNQTSLRFFHGIPGPG